MPVLVVFVISVVVGAASAAIASYCKWLMVKALVAKAKPSDVPRLAEAVFKPEIRRPVERVEAARREIGRK
ncbi:hypothetical protein [Amycolatopsis nalaikhensis]|uniref:Secreted protein n=1 Tax=Amycolatopsis nalaikhensis TaxID=715472 RepID=A0ABY8XYH4_9PSEU|nr:hypothetical protein [Amycolatopsis sp. 2-2]WIV60648.1 hypothetical protein QP939_19580 [Amycolatopsis sp. 2-2]